MSQKLHLVQIINLDFQYFVTRFQSLGLEITSYIIHVLVSWCTIFTLHFEILQLYSKKLTHNSFGLQPINMDALGLINNHIGDYIPSMVDEHFHPPS
jgi:hypothetical protein